ncbi:hypothetical protein H9P43_003844 [Blastocladiella emersonii ATCC 22665]|nr:hypothetical protein H9P43_003844 [Blastocladiella emersonii ATCC 22665]
MTAQPPAPPPLNLHVPHVDAHPPDATTGPRRSVTSTPSTSTSCCNGARWVRGNVFASILTKFAILTKFTTWYAGAEYAESRRQGPPLNHRVDSRTTRSSPRASVNDDKPQLRSRSRGRGEVSLLGSSLASNTRLAARASPSSRSSSTSSCSGKGHFVDWNLKHKLGIKDIEAFGKELTKALQTIRKPFKEKTEWFDLVQAAADNSCIITNKAPEELHRATLAMVDEYDDADLDMDFADADVDAAMSVRACRGAHPLYVSFLDRLLFGQANDMANARGSNQSSHGTALLTKSHSIPSLTFRTVAMRMAGYTIVNDLKLLDINKPFPIDGSSPVWRIMAAVAVLCAWRITGSAYQQGIIVGLTKEDVKVTLADYYDAFLVSSTGSVSVAKRIYLASQLRALFKRGILNVSLAEIAQQNTGVETTKTQAAMTVDIANDICPDE